MGRKTTLCRGVADAWGPVAVAASEAGRRAGVSSALGWLAGLAARVGLPAHEAGLLAGPGAAARASWAGWLGRLLLRASGPSRPSQLRVFSLSFLFLVLFFFSFV